MIWDDARTVAFDFEASGTLPEYALQPWRFKTGDFWATSISVIARTATALEPWMAQLFPTVTHMRTFLEAAIANDWLVVTWNGIYDISVLIAYGLRDLVYKVRWLDGMLLWKHLEVEPEYEKTRAQKRSYKLKPDAVQRFAPQFTDTTGADEVDFHSTDPNDLAKLQHYNNRDSVRTWAFAKIVWNLLTEQQRSAAMIEAASLPMIAEANLTGLPIDPLVAHELAASLDKTAADMLEKLGPHGVTEKIVRSPLQLQKLMFDDWGLPVLKENRGKKTGKVSRSTDKEVLHELSFIDARCRDLRSYREALNNKTKFAENPMVSATYNGDWRTRPQCIPFGTYTGRCTYSSTQGRKGTKEERQTGFALHQEKREAEFRRVVKSPTGYTIVEFDAAGQEFRWMATYSGDPNMLQLCLPGEDPHAFMGARIVGKDYRYLQASAKVKGSQDEQDRYLGKFANLASQYRTGVKTLRVRARTDYDIPLEMPQANLVWRTYRNTYTEVPKYWDRAIQKVKYLGYAETMAGRRVQVVGDWGGSMGWQMESTALNYPIQGTGGDQKYLALKVLKDLMVEVNGYFAWDLHDGLYFFIPDDKVDIFVWRGKAMLDNLPYQQAWGFTPPVPMPFDVKVGKVWGALKEVKDG